MPFGTKKTRMLWLPEGGKSLRICITISTKYRRVTDRRTDRHLSTAESALCIASSGKNILGEKVILL